MKPAKLTHARWKGDSLELGSSGGINFMNLLFPAFAAGPLLWKAIKAEQGGYALFLLVASLGLFGLLLYLAGRGVARTTRTLVIEPDGILWRGGASHNLAPDPGGEVRAPRSALTKVWLHGPGRSAPRGPWIMSLVLEGDGLPLDAAVDARSDRDQALRLASELAERLRVPFEDRTG